MDGGSCDRSYVKGRTRTFYDRRCKNKKTNIYSLPDDVVFNILVRVPAQDIYNSVRLVCRKWYHIINSPNFIYSHLHRSTCGLLTQSPGDPKRTPTFVAMQNGRVEISKLIYKDIGFILSSCNGLILERCKEYYHLYVRNPATNRRIVLPRFCLEPLVRCNVIAYAPTSMKYKVVYTFLDLKSNSRSCAMLTIGVDKSWRLIVSYKHSSPMAMELLAVNPMTTEGFVFWAKKDNVLMLNVETETFTLIPAPLCRGEKRLEYYYYLPAGSYLSLLIACTKFSWEVWEMKPESGEWSKLFDIDLEAQKCEFNCESLKPVGWLNYREVLVFNACKKVSFHTFRPSRPSFAYNNTGPTRTCFAYNVGTQEIHSFELAFATDSFIIHRSSLVWLDGCC